MPLFPKYQSELLPITAGLLGSTLAVLISTGWMVKIFTGRKIKAEMGAGNLDGEGNLDV
ncbi:MAG: hypothetical protein IMW85_05755 [Thermicanus sp.]|nr:hypothetical protein [Thermicanus sp.]